MIDSLTGIQWYETNPLLDSLISPGAELLFSPLSPGLEADVGKITFENKHYVVKIWSKHSKPDVQRQYLLLKALYRQGIRVSEPVGYGRTETGVAVLLTRYHGAAVMKVSPSIFKKIAAVFAEIHRLSLNELEDYSLARYDFVTYFFSGIEAFPAMKEAVTRLVAAADMRIDRIVHCDFHLANILEENGQYTVIDWTNAQVGDPRYDLSWTCFLLRIYLSESKSLTFLAKYHEEMPEMQGDLEVFEALACLRWLLLNRIAVVPKHADTMKKVTQVVRDNRYLSGGMLDLKIQSWFD